MQSLVWSGACQVRNQNACDFRAWNINGTDYMSTILYKNHNDPVGHGIIMDSSYRIVKDVLPPAEHAGLNMHELNIVNNGTAVLYFTFRPEWVNISMLPDQVVSHGWIMNMGIREVDLRTGQANFEWWAHPEISLTESNVAMQSLHGPFPHAWNWFHGNSIVKNDDGDYMISSRYTDAIYKISGSKGKIVWRLGGRMSDFEMKDFNFSRQHDAQWVATECDDNIETITLLDNGSDGITSTANVSSAIKIRMDKATMTASVLQRWIRPDNSRSDLRGNFQTLPDGNVFAAWSDNSFISEHTGEGDLIMAAEFTSERFVTYRAYKFNFTGAPLEPPVMKAFAYGVDPASCTTVFYMSWNGATEVDSWNLYRIAPRDSEIELIGNAKKTGFETRFQARGYEDEVFAEGIAADGTVLGQSATFIVEPPAEWGWDLIEDSDVGMAEQIHLTEAEESDDGKNGQIPWTKTEL